jgi:hypothetical protein
VETANALSKYQMRWLLKGMGDGTAVLLKEVVQTGLLLTNLFFEVFRYGNYEAEGGELH